MFYLWFSASECSVDFFQIVDQPFSYECTNLSNAIDRFWNDFRQEQLIVSLNWIHKRFWWRVKRSFDYLRFAKDKSIEANCVPKAFYIFLSLNYVFSQWILFAHVKFFFEIDKKFVQLQFILMFLIISLLIVVRFPRPSDQFRLSFFVRNRDIEGWRKKNGRITFLVFITITTNKTEGFITIVGVVVRRTILASQLYEKINRNSFFNRPKTMSFSLRLQGSCRLWLMKKFFFFLHSIKDRLVRLKDNYRSWDSSFSIQSFDIKFLWNS